MRARILPWFAQHGYRKDRTFEEKKVLEKEWEEIKSNTQEKFINNEVNLLVGTKGFGMGIKTKYQVHYSLWFLGH